MPGGDRLAHPGAAPGRRVPRFAYLPEYDLWARKVCHVYLARPVLRYGEPREAGHRAIWMPIATALDLLAIEGDRAFRGGGAGEGGG